jgi:hypothetical protein
MDSATVRELAKGVSSYFLNYLETDFKKQQTPGRRLQLQREGGLRVGLSLSRYAPLNTAFWTALSKPTSDLEPLTVTRRGYTSTLSDRFRETVVRAVQSIDSDAYAQTRQNIVACAEATKAESDYADGWVADMFRAAAEEICERIVHPLLASLEPVLRKEAQSLLDATYDLEGELTNLLLQPLNDDFSTSLYVMASSGKTDDLWEVLTRLFSRDRSSNVLVEYFDIFATADAYVDVKQLWTSMKSKENQEIYLYIGVLSFRKLTFPLFYVPLTVEMEESTTKFRITLKPQVLVYKRAVDYILQETSIKAESASPISERILYATGDDSLASRFEIPTVQVLSALRLPPEFRISVSQNEAAATPTYSLESSLHLAVHDKSDESLLNDYEQLLTAARGKGGPILDLFESMVRSVILEDPASVDSTVSDAWEATGVADRLVQASPIPINEEQCKIISALKQPDCRFVLVEGPPGTGKSHTISAIAFDAILSKKSVLILSDKREALDVVENKLEQTLASVRPSGVDFPNPILRLGKESNNFRSLLQGSTVQQIQDYHRASKAKEGAINSELEANISELKGDLNKVAGSLSRIQVRRVADVQHREQELESVSPGAAEAIRRALSKAIRSALVKSVDQIPASLEQNLAQLVEQGTESSIRQLQRTAEAYEFAVSLSAQVDCSSLKRFDHLHEGDLVKINTCLANTDSLKRPIIGFLFRGTALEQLSQQLNAELAVKTLIKFPSDIPLLRQVAAAIAGIVNRCRQNPAISPDAILSIILTGDGGKGFAHVALPIREFASLFPNEAPPELRYDQARFRTVGGYAAFLSNAIRYAVEFESLRSEFGAVPDMDFIGGRTKIEQLYSTRMASEIDGRFLSFVQEHRAEARSLGAVIRARQKFPEERFDLLRSAFPVIIASIREFAEYMPLLPGIFDTVIIDEASQVSIAQAFPAILRAKKVVVLGDGKQFSNVKSSQASNELNQQCRGDLERLFRQKVSNDAGRLQRIAMFDVKKSVLEFVDNCANYKTMLRKHFRGYLELISFSSKYFYGGTLQAVKIRGCPIEDVIKFSSVKAEAEEENVNTAEGQYILARLREFVQQEKPVTVGVITPFRNQQIALQKLFSGDSQGSEFESKLRLKVMTFDSCQGEERGIIFYSLVASEHSDRLSWIFPPSLDQAEGKIEDNLRMQRLNVGFSRAQETIWFVLSKPLTDYKGSIGRVLTHYSGILTTKGIADAGETDSTSPMERQVLEWLKATRLFQNHGESLELIAQFPIGDYLRQLDPTYVHPAWKVDFLLRAPTKSGRAVQIIIEYDGFEFHFTSPEKVHVGNFAQYMTEADVERQKTLESYGYKFLRLNRFNIGENPVVNLSERLEKLVDGGQIQVRSLAIDAIGETVKALQDGSQKICSRCNKLRKKIDFYDKSLAGGTGGHGRVCMSCKLSRF